MPTRFALLGCLWLVACAGPTAPTPMPSPDATPEVSAAPTPDLPAEVEATPLGEPTLGAPEHLADTLASLEGLWAYAGEVWQIGEGEMLVYRPLDEDITTTRELEVLAPCLLAVREAGERIGLYAIQRKFGKTPGTQSGATALVARGTTAHQVDNPPRYGELPPPPYTVCDIHEGLEPAVYVAEGQTCKAWLFNFDTELFEPRICSLGLPDEHRNRVASLLDERGDIVRRTSIPPKFWEGKRAYRAPNAASACGGLPADGPGCSPAQAAMLDELYWSGEGAACSGSSFRIELEPLFEGELLDGPEACPRQVREGEPTFALESGLVAPPASARVRPGGEVELEFVLENQDSAPHFARLPTSMWHFRVRKDGQDYPLGECAGLGLVGSGPRTNAVEYRLDPGGTLTLVARWWARSPVTRGEDCAIRPLKSGTYTVELIEDVEPSAKLLFSTEVRVAGKKTCDPCPPAGD